jgi:hypothetical protein
MIVWGGCYREDGGGCGNATYYNTGGSLDIFYAEIYLPLVQK